MPPFIFSHIDHADRRRIDEARQIRLQILKTR
jgi:hypothetical protein